MCDFGITAMVTSIVAAVVSTTMGVVSSVQQGKSAQSQMNYQAAVAAKNAKTAQQNADMKRQEGIEEARTHRIKTIQKVGAQQAAMAANGFDASVGTNLDVITDTSATGELDALTAQYNKETQALSFEAQASNFENQANLDMLAGQNAYKSGMMSAVGTGLNGLASVSGQVANNWYKPDSVGNNAIYNTQKTSGKSWKSNIDYGYTGNFSGLG